MTFCTETWNGEVVEVTTLFDKNGNETMNLLEAEAAVIHFPDDQWVPVTLDFGPIYRVH